MLRAVFTLHEGCIGACVLGRLYTLEFCLLGLSVIFTSLVPITHVLYTPGVGLIELWSERGIVLVRVAAERI